MKRLLLILLIFSKFILADTPTPTDLEYQKTTELIEEYNHYKQLGDYPKSLILLEKLIHIYEVNDQKESLIGMYMEIGILYTSLHDYIKAETSIQKAINLSKDNPKKADFYYSAVNWMARVTLLSGQYKKSLFYHEKVIDLLDQNNTLACAYNYGNIAILLQKMYRADEALEYLHKSDTIFKKENPQNIRDIIINYGNIGTAYLNKGDKINGLKYLKKSIEILKKNPKYAPMYLDTAYLNIATLYMNLSENKEGEIYVKKALELHKKHHREDKLTAKLYTLLAVLYQRDGAYKEALKYHEKSIKLYKKLSLEYSVESLNAYKHFASYYKLKEEWTQAKIYYDKGFKIIKKLWGKKSIKASFYYEDIASLYMHKGSDKKALDFFQKSLVLKEKLLGKDHPETIQTIENLGGVWNNLGNAQESYKNIKYAFDFFMKRDDLLFSDLLNNKQKRIYIKKHRYRLKLLLGSASSYQKDDISITTFNDWINYKGKLFERENMINTLYSEANTTLKIRIEKLHKAKRDLATLYQQKPTPTQYTTWETTITSIEKTILTLEKKLEKKIPNSLKSISHHDVAKYLKKDELYLDFAVVKGRYYLFTVDNNATVGFERFSWEDSRRTTTLIMKFRQAVKQSEPTRSIVSELYEILMEHVRQNKKHYVISTDGFLRLFPFEALYDKKTKQYLVSTKEIRYVPSAREFLRLHRNKTKSISNEVVLFSNPDFDTNLTQKTRTIENEALFNMQFSKLPGTHKEAEKIKQILQNQKIISFEKTEANEENLLALKSPKILHIATHGFFLNSNLPNPMLNSGIVLSGANSALKQHHSNGIVTALKLSGLKLSGTELVVLSACDTGIVDLRETQSISSLSKAFILAGVDDVIVSLWEVSDNDTQIMMGYFYTYIAKGKNYKNALKLAKLDMIKENRPISSWAAFILNGK